VVELGSDVPELNQENIGSGGLWKEEGKEGDFCHNKRNLCFCFTFCFFGEKVEL